MQVMLTLWAGCSGSKLTLSIIATKSPGPFQVKFSRTNDPLLPTTSTPTSWSLSLVEAITILTLPDPAGPGTDSAKETGLPMGAFSVAVTKSRENQRSRASAPGTSFQ